MLKPLSLSIASCDTPVGTFSIVCQGDIAYAAGFGDEASLRQRLPAWLRDVSIIPVANHPYLAPIRRYFAGDMRALQHIHHFQHASEFYQNVYRAIAQIAPGTTVSYRDIARYLGVPGAIRAVTEACRRNALPLIIPCHRVIRTSEEHGSYSHEPGIKTYLLEFERAWVRSQPTEST